MIKIELRGEKILYSPEDIVTMILEVLKNLKEYEVKKPITEALMIVPACFSNLQRQVIRKAAIDAGLSGVDFDNPQLLLNKPSAAALAYASEMVPNI